MTILGRLLGEVDFVNNNIEAMLLAIVFVSVLPVIFEFGREHLKRRRTPA